jgi:hypothetical protein
MQVPPEKPRRRKLRRGRVVIAVGLLALCAGSGFSYWQQTRFPARSIPLAGMPVTLRVQNGVSGRELAAVKSGLRFEDGFMERVLGRSVRRPVVARVAHRNGCRPFESSNSDSIGEADDGFLCVATRNLHWKWLVQTDPPAAKAVSAHEYVHVLQAELGCLRSDRNEMFRWLVEGMAEEMSWRALVAARQTTDRRVEKEIRADALPSYGIGGRDLYPLASYERADGADREYALWHLAVRRLMKTAVDSGAAPASRPEVSLRRFCARVGHGLDWRAAFVRSFGRPIGDFYARFERFRRRAALHVMRERAG